MYYAKKIKGIETREDTQSSSQAAYLGSATNQKPGAYLQGYTELHFNFHGSVHRKNILIYIQHDATLHPLFYLETALHVSGGTTTRHQERKQLYLQHLVFATPLLLPAASG